MKYRLKKTVDPDVVEAIKLTEEKIIEGKYFGKFAAKPGEWLITYADGKEEVLSEKDFKKLFEPVKNLLFD